jgi:hypothetical protein
MKRGWLGLVGAVLPTLLGAQAGRGGGPYARIAILRAHDGHTVDFEAGYIRQATRSTSTCPHPHAARGSRSRPLDSSSPRWTWSPSPGRNRRSRRPSQQANQPSECVT